MRFSGLLRAPYLFVSFCSAGFFVGPDFFRTKARDPHVPLTFWKRERRSARSTPTAHRESGLVVTNITGSTPGWSRWESSAGDPCISYKSFPKAEQQRATQH